MRNICVNRKLNTDYNDLLQRLYDAEWESFRGRGNYEYYSDLFGEAAEAIDFLAARNKELEYSQSYKNANL